MPDLPLKLITNILSRLPVKSLLRFRCVSKPWRSLIDGQDFTKLHLKRSIETHSNLTLILGNTSLYTIDFNTLNDIVQLNLPTNTPAEYTQLYGSCSGLLCFFYSERKIFLLNFSTRKHYFLPFSDIGFPGYYTAYTSITFAYGFGYDSISDDYKVVRIVQVYNAHLISFYCGVKVFSLKENSWRRVGDIPYYFQLYNSGIGVFACGALHWKVTKKRDTGSLIVGFDLGSEGYRVVPWPDGDHDASFEVLGVLGGCLSLICNYEGGFVDVWVMKEYGVKESWTKLFSVQRPEGNRFTTLMPLDYSKGGGEVLYLQQNERLGWYDLEKKSVNNVSIRGLPRISRARICVQSLVPLNDDDGIDRQKQQAGKEEEVK